MTRKNLDNYVNHLSAGRADVAQIVGLIGLTIGAAYNSEKALLGGGLFF